LKSARVSSSSPSFFPVRIRSSWNSAHPIERSLDRCHRFGVRLQIGGLAREQIASLAGLGVGDQRDELAQGLLAHLRGVHALDGRVEPRLPGRREEEQADQEANQQQGRHRDIPSAEFAQFLAQDFHMNVRTLADEFNMWGYSYRTGGGVPMVRPPGPRQNAGQNYCDIVLRVP
jgi:hypothetical protein